MEQVISEDVPIGQCKWCGADRYVKDRREVGHVCRIDLD